jgi:hypothetical protein
VEAESLEDRQFCNENGELGNFYRAQPDMFESVRTRRNSESFGSAPIW